MAPLEPWEKVLVDADAFAADVHSQFACTDCHGGEQSNEKEAAHTGLIAYPSTEPELCSRCHSDIATAYANSLHNTQAGYWTTINARSVPENHPQLEEMFGNHCASCHTSCGDCHVSQPRSVGGGFVDGHVFDATPSMTQNCTACHGSRVGNEYLGKHEDLMGDVHFRQGRMKCTDCHSGDQLHGSAAGTAPDPAGHRYEGMQTPACETCHPDAKTNTEIVQHQIHGNKLSCQVCHSITYTSCDGCHVAISEETGNPYFSTEGSYFTFLIGRNPRQDENRPYEYVPVRHIPIAPTSYEYYGEDLLTNFDSLPTWAYATPHNIQRVTPQNQTCEACHDNAELFLTADKVAEAELSANQGVIVEMIPPGVSGINATLPLPADHADYTICLACHNAGGEIPALPENHADYTDEDCSQCHKVP